MAIQRIGVYGGTFDPIHNGHVAISLAVIENFGLDLLLIVPASCPPHKRKAAVSDPYHRYTLAVLATLDKDGILVSTIEIEQPERPYTYQTLEQLKDRYRSADLFFVLGSDSFEELHLWKEPLRILEAANVIVAARPGYEMRNNQLLRLLSERHSQSKTSEPGAEWTDYVEDLRDNFHRLNGEPVECQSKNGRIFLTDYAWHDISSTEVRDLARQGLSIRELVPPAVANYIEKYRIYRNVENDGSQS